jgi:hypothetical protein
MCGGKTVRRRAFLNALPTFRIPAEHFSEHSHNLLQPIFNVFKGGTGTFGADAKRGRHFRLNDCMELKPVTSSGSGFKEEGQKY